MEVSEKGTRNTRATLPLQQPPGSLYFTTLHHPTLYTYSTLLSTPTIILLSNIYSFYIFSTSFTNTTHYPHGMPERDFPPKVYSYPLSVDLWPVRTLLAIENK